jgi:hypothetical protein
MIWLAWYLAVTFGLVAMAWWPCCCHEPVVPPWCDLCVTDTDNDISITFSGVSDGEYLGNACDCSVVNATFILPGRSSTADYCLWKRVYGSDATIDCGVKVGLWVTYSISFGSNTLTQSAFAFTAFSYAATGYYGQWTNATLHIPPPKWDCGDTYNIGGGTQGSPARVCLFTGATAVIN